MIFPRDLPRDVRCVRYTVPAPCAAAVYCAQRCSKRGFAHRASRGVLTKLGLHPAYSATTLVHGLRACGGRDETANAWLESDRGCYRTRCVLRLRAYGRCLHTNG